MNVQAVCDLKFLNIVARDLVQPIMLLFLMLGP